MTETPTTDEAKTLQLAPDEWVMEGHRSTWATADTVVEFAIGVHAATHFAWAYDFTVPDSASRQGSQT